MTNITGIYSTYDATYLSTLGSTPLGLHSSTQFVINATGYKVTVVGTSLAYTAGKPSGGTITGFTVLPTGGTATTWTGLSVSASSLWNAVTSGNLTAFDNLLYSGNDTFTAAGGLPGYSTSFAGFGGDDVFDMQDTVGVDILSGGNGNDTFNYGSNLSDIAMIDGGAGTDTINLDGDYLPNSGLPGLIFFPNVLTNIEIINLSGGHSYSLRTDDSTIASGATLTVNASGLGANDYLILDGGTETNGAFSVTAGAGNDTFVSGGGNDTFAGGSGSDTIDYSHATSAVTVNLNLTTAQAVGGGEGTDTLTSVENLIGSRFNDSLTGNGGDNILTGGAGNDVLNGGAGNDTASYMNASAGVTVNLGLTGPQNVGADAGTDTFVSIEDVIGSAFDDTFVGNSADNAFDGRSGKDTVSYDNAIGPVSVDLAFDGVQAQGDSSGDGHDTLNSIENIVGSHFSDTVSFALSTSGLDISLPSGIVSDGFMTLGHLDSIENIIGTPYDDSIDAETGATPLSLDGGAGDDSFLVSGAGAVTIIGGAGDDTMRLQFNAASSVDGGAGTDVVSFSNFTNAQFGPATITHVEVVHLINPGASSITVKTDDANVSAGATLTVSLDDQGRSAFFDGSAETDGNFILRANTSGGHLVGGAGIDEVAFSGTRAQYGIVNSGVAGLAVNDGHNIVQLTSIEKLSFADADLFVRAYPLDFDGDLKSDLLWQNDNGQVAIWIMDGLNQYAGSIVGGNPGTSWHARVGGDFNGDGMADILWQNDDGQAAIWTMNGQAIYTAIGPTQLGGNPVGGNPGPSWHIITAADFNGDGKADILWQNDNGQAAIWTMDGFTQLGGAQVGGNPGPAWHIKGAGDFNGDGKADILWQNDNGQAAIWTMNGFSQLGGAPVGGNPGPTWHVVGASDFNGDGKSDILWQNDNGQAAIWTMDGFNQLGGSQVGGNPGPTWHVKGAGDFNGDGKADIIWQNDNGQAAIWTMNGFTQLGGSPVGGNPGSTWHIVTSS